MLLWLKNLWVAFWAVNQAYPVGWWITIFHPPILAQATMLVSLRGNLRPLLILDMLVMFHGFSGIFWLKKHQFLQRLQVLIAWKIAAVLITCALDQRQMEREFAWFLQPGTLTSLLKWIRHRWNICFRDYSSIRLGYRFWEMGIWGCMLRFCSNPFAPFMFRLSL